MANVQEVQIRNSFTLNNKQTDSKINTHIQFKFINKTKKHFTKARLEFKNKNLVKFTTNRTKFKPNQKQMESIEWKNLKQKLYLYKISHPHTNTPQKH